MNFGNNLKDLRETRNVTQGQLAEYLQVSRPTIAGYETKSRQPDFEKLEKLANYFHVSIDYLVSGSETTSTDIPLKKRAERKIHMVVMWLWLIRNYHSNPNRMS